MRLTKLGFLVSFLSLTSSSFADPKVERKIHGPEVVSPQEGRSNVKKTELTGRLVLVVKEDGDVQLSIISDGEAIPLYERDATLNSSLREERYKDRIDTKISGYFTKIKGKVVFGVQDIRPGKTTGEKASYSLEDFKRAGAIAVVPQSKNFDEAIKYAASLGFTADDVIKSGNRFLVRLSPSLDEEALKKLMSSELIMKVEPVSKKSIGS